jgi:translation initiation factor IF-2
MKGSMASLKIAKRDVSEVRIGKECGMGFEGWFEFQVGDLVQSYDVIEEKRRL